MRTLLVIGLLAATGLQGFAESPSDSLRLTLGDAIALAQQQSSDALAARHTLEAAEWSYKNFRANYLPAVSLNSSPSLNRQISSITQPDGTNVFVRQNQLSTDLSLNISQNVALTGGTLFVRNNLQRLDAVFSFSSSVFVRSGQVE